MDPNANPQTAPTAPEPNPPLAQPPAPEPAKETASAASIPNVPDTWPGGFGAYKFSKQAVKLSLGTIVVLWLINILLGGGLESAFGKSGNLLSFILGGVFEIALVTTYLASVKGRRVSLGESFAKVKPAMILKILVLSILVALSLVLSALALVIPFFFVLPRLALANYFLVDKDLGIIEAYKASWNSTKGHAGKVWGIFLATLAMALLILTIVGIPFAIYFLIMYSASTAVLYEYITKKSSASVPATATPAEPAATPAAA